MMLMIVAMTMLCIPQSERKKEMEEGEKTEARNKRKKEEEDLRFVA